MSLFCWKVKAVGLLVLAAAVVVTSRPAWAAGEPLKADELLLVYNGDDVASKELADYYARVRSVPADRLFAVHASPRDEEISREDFNRSIRGPIRAHLVSQEYGPRIRCIVLFYGLPIRVGPKKVTPAEQQLAEKWRKELREGITKLAEVTAVMSGQASQPASAPADDELALGPAAARYERARNQAAQKLDQMRRNGGGQQETVQLMGMIQEVEGAYSMAVRAKAASNLASANAAQIEQVLKNFQKEEAQIGEMRSHGMNDPSYEEARKLIRQNHGLMGYLKSLAYDINQTRTEETVASMDSELTLACWDDYPLHRWIPNVLSWRVRANPALLAGASNGQRQTRVLMTCRIDGPTKQVAKRIIDDSIAAEKTGLSGNIFIDARGLHGDKMFGDYDDDLRELAEMAAATAQLPVKLDNKPALFGAGDCPNTMLYCGWYSLRHFVDAFDFVRGAVAYHIASFEAVSIKAPVEKGWVRGLLNDGVAATIGPVAEPYLQSFPKPSRFFGLLLTGQFTLAECYAYTADFNSWMMLLIGDPLYRPFAAAPKLRLDQVYPADQIPPEFRAAPPATR